MIDLTADTPNKSHAGSAPFSTTAKRKSEFPIHYSIRVSLIDGRSFSRTSRTKPQRTRNSETRSLGLHLKPSEKTVSHGIAYRTQARVWC